ncbi:butyrophilin subfamily 1 member A1-like [Aquarana catesbeiana]|uniref:butyrophilin subfamily 1 member A1-like n=1 Tax=Aquarana catesbeiana TaxID=8400 RepID=UPI003CCA36ED
MVKRFQEKGYSLENLEKIKQTVGEMNRDDLFKSKSKGENNFSLSFITGFNRQYRDLERIIKRHWPLLHRDDDLRKISYFLSVVVMDFCHFIIGRVFGRIKFYCYLGSCLERKNQQQGLSALLLESLHILYGKTLSGRMMLLWSVILIFYPNLSFGATFNVYSQTKSVRVSVGEDALISCYLKPEINAENMEIKWLRSKDASLVHHYRSGRDETVNKDFYGRIQLIKDELKRGNISLRIQNIKVLDEGFYTCYFQNEYMFDEDTTEILPVAIGTGPEFQIGYYSKDKMNISCFSSHWYPKPEAYWIDNNSKRLKEHSISVTPNEANMYNVKTSIYFNKTAKKISCLIQNAQPGGLRVAAIHIADSVFPETSGLIASIIIGVLVPIILVVIWYVRRVLHKREKKREFNKALQNTVEVNLDPDTAHAELEVSEDLKRLSRAPIRKDVQMNDRRFGTRLYVLGAEPLRKGKCYWQVNVQNAAHWTIGVAHDNVNRIGKINLLPKEGFWTIERINNDYKALVNINVPIQIYGILQTVGVYVNAEKHKLIFFNNDNGQILYKYEDISLNKEPLLPFFSTWTLNESIHLCSKDCPHCVPNASNETKNMLPQNFNQNNLDQV